MCKLVMFMLLLFIPQITYNSLHCGPKRFAGVFVQANFLGTAPATSFLFPANVFYIPASSKCAEHTRALLVICVLKENTHYNNCPIVYSDLSKLILVNIILHSAG